MNPVEWVIDGMAELVVAKRENRMLCEISRRAWIIALGYFAAFFGTVVIVAEWLL